MHHIFRDEPHSEFVNLVMEIDYKEYPVFVLIDDGVELMDWVDAVDQCYERNINMMDLKRCSSPKQVLRAAQEWWNA